MPDEHDEVKKEEGKTPPTDEELLTMVEQAIASEGKEVLTAEEVSTIFGDD